LTIKLTNLRRHAPRVKPGLHKAADVVCNYMARPDIVYKFRNFTSNFHLRLLTNNEIYFSSPSDFNDPFDLKISVDYSLLTTEERRIKYIDKILGQAFPNLNTSGAIYGRNRQELIKKFKEDWLTLQEQYDTVNFKWTDDRLGVVSFSLQWDNILLWSHYSDNHTGFSVGIDMEELRKLGVIGAEGRVDYLESFPKIDPIETSLINELHTKAFSKSQVWRYEAEYRIVQIWSESTPHIGERTKIITDSCFKELILGMKISEENERKLCLIAKDKQIPVYKTIKKKGFFAVERIAI
jgi:hypothetical protein